MKAEIEGRPLLAASLALIAGVSTAWHPVNALFLALLLAIVFRKMATALWVGAAFLIGLLIAPPQFRVSQTKTGGWTGVGKVISVPSLGLSGLLCELQTPSGTVQLAVRGREDIAFGQTLRVSGHILPPHGEPGQRLLLQNERATVSCLPDNVQILESGPSWFELSNAWRNSFVSGIRRSMNPAEASLVDSLCFSATGAMDPGTKRDLGRIGAVHILSASGLQVFLFAFLVQFLLSMAPISRETQLAVLVLVLAFYASATGLHPSTLRAVLMVVLAMSAYLFGREQDFLSALGIAAIVTVFWQPWSIYTPGFQLSYVTVGALSLYWKPFWAPHSKKTVDKLASRLWFLLRASLVATLASAPLTAYHFGEIPLVSPVTNLLIAPALPAIIVVAMLSWPLGLIAPWLQLGLLKVVAAPLADWVLMVSGLFGRQSWAAIQVPIFSPYWIVLYYGAFLIMWQRRVRR